MPHKVLIWQLGAEAVPHPLPRRLHLSVPCPNSWDNLLSRIKSGRNTLLESDHSRRYSEQMAKVDRRPIPSQTELLVLDRSRRRCALCYKMKGDLTEKRGQIAHLDQNPAKLCRR